MWVNLAAVLFSALGFIIITHFGKHRAAAHLVTFAIYLSTVGVMVISGGIHSSSVGWQVFVPIAAFIMSGLWTGLRWGVLCLITVIVAYVLETAGITKFTGFEVNMFDRLIDLGGAILATSIAIWYSDRLKSRSLMQLEEAKAQLNYYATIDPLTNIFNRRLSLNCRNEKSKELIQPMATHHSFCSISTISKKSTTNMGTSSAIKFFEVLHRLVSNIYVPMMYWKLQWGGICHIASRDQTRRCKTYCRTHQASH